MPLNAEALESAIISKLKSEGFVTNNQYAKTEKMAKAIAEAVVEHITANAQVVIESGSSAGTYGVE